MRFEAGLLEAIRSDERVVWSEDIIRYADIDANHHVNNTVFSVLCESGRVNLFRSRFGEAPRASFYFVVARLTIDFLGELRYPGRVRTGTWVSKLGNTSLQLRQVILDESGRPAAMSDCVSVSMDAATRRPAPLPEAIRREAEALLLPDPTSY
jgi:acyl-CoA thioester hydrolase